MPILWDSGSVVTSSKHIDPTTVVVLVWRERGREGGSCLN